MGSLFPSMSKKKKIQRGLFGRLYSTLFNIVTQKSDNNGSRFEIYRSHAGVISDCSHYGLINFKRLGLNAAHSTHHVVVVRCLQKLRDRPI